VVNVLNVCEFKVTDKRVVDICHFYFLKNKWINSEYILGVSLVCVCVWGRCQYLKRKTEPAFERRMSFFNRTPYHCAELWSTVDHCHQSTCTILPLSHFWSIWTRIHNLSLQLSVWHNIHTHASMLRLGDSCKTYALSNVSSSCHLVDVRFTHTLTEVSILQQRTHISNVIEKMRFQVLTAVSMKMAVLWVVALCSLV
jgi:hypothetical protein